MPESDPSVSMGRGIPFFYIEQNGNKSTCDVKHRQGIEWNMLEKTFREEANDKTSERGRKTFHGVVNEKIR